MWGSTHFTTDSTESASHVTGKMANLEGKALDKSAEVKSQQPPAGDATYLSVQLSQFLNICLGEITWSKERREWYPANKRRVMMDWLWEPPTTKIYTNSGTSGPNKTLLSVLQCVIRDSCVAWLHILHTHSGIYCSSCPGLFCFPCSADCVKKESHPKREKQVCLLRVEQLTHQLLNIHQAPAERLLSLLARHS